VILLYQDANSTFRDKDHNYPVNEYAHAIAAGDKKRPAGGGTPTASGDMVRHRHDIDSKRYKRSFGKNDR
jgi:hypothetical protein